MGQRFRLVNSSPVQRAGYGVKVRNKEVLLGHHVGVASTRQHGILWQIVTLESCVESNAAEQPHKGCVMEEDMARDGKGNG